MRRMNKNHVGDVVAAGALGRRATTWPGVLCAIMVEVGFLVVAMPSTGSAGVAPTIVAEPITVGGAVDISAALVLVRDQPCSGVRASIECGTDSLENVLRTQWWDATNKHFVPTQHDGGPKNGLYSSQSDTAMSVWQMAQIANETYWEWKAAKSDVARRELVQQWAYIRSRFTPAQLGSDGRADGSVVFSDDAVWKAQYLAQAHEITGDPTALTALGNMIAATARRFADPNQQAVNYGTAPDGGRFGVGPYGLLYVPADDVSNTATYGYISSSYEAGLAIAAEYYYQQTRNAGYHRYAVATYDWIKTYLSTPAPADASRKAQHLIEAGLNLDPNIHQSKTQEYYLKPRQAWFGKPIRFLDSTYIGGLFMEAQLGALLYEGRTAGTFVADIDNMARSLVSPQGYGRTLNGKTVLCNCRDPWTDAFGAPGFVYYALSLAGVDSDDTVKQAIVNTAAAILNNDRADAKGYTADWSGPESDRGSPAYATYQERYNGAPGGEAGFQQLMTTANTASLARAGSMIVNEQGFGGAQ